MCCGICNYSLFQYYIHSPFDVAHITSKTSHTLKESEEMEINYKMTETSASTNIKYLSTAQRKCRFEDEPLTKDVSIYSISMCKMLCRYKMSIRFCGCKPFFYHFLRKYLNIHTSLGRLFYCTIITCYHVPASLYMFNLSEILK